MRTLINCLLAIRAKFEWFPLFFARICIGLFFAISGYNKLFTPASQQQILDTLVKAGVPFPHFGAIFIPAVEFIGGILLVLGLLTSITAIVLFILLIVAIVTDGVHKIPANLAPLDWLDYFLYLPEVIYEFILIWLIIFGSGCIGIDAWIRSRWKKKST